MGGKKSWKAKNLSTSPVVETKPSIFVADSKPVWVAKGSSNVAVQSSPNHEINGNGNSIVDNINRGSATMATEVGVSSSDLNVPLAAALSPGKKHPLMACAQIRATFYPKFENEKSDQEIRMRMIEVVASGKGVLEVTLKHSGSLFMYSGDNGGAFAKNSYGNLYTAVGVFVLGRTLKEAWGMEGTKKQQEFNAFLKEQKICIAMELVTAVLGDHGQRPRQDYVVVTAVTELQGRPKFYSTPDLIAFCRRWRLPTNNVWLFSSRNSVTSFFAAYDALCEEGIAKTVQEALDEIADLHVPATKSHSEVQGEILEGLVARVVDPLSLQLLEDVLRNIPLAPQPGEKWQGPSLREICTSNRQSENQQIRALLAAVGQDFCPDTSEWLERRDQEPGSLLSNFMRAVPFDQTTSKIQEIIHLLRQKKMPVRFKCHISQSKETLDRKHMIPPGATRFKITIHVLADSVFQRYQRQMTYQPGLWPLYRGFFVDVALFKGQSDSLSVGHEIELENQTSSLKLSQGRQDELADETEHLMLKLKFLPYKIRTFLIRNGLDVLFKKGPSAYREYYYRQLKKWGTSHQKQRELSVLLDEWAGYILKRVRTGKLDSNIYLTEAEPFLHQFAERSAKNRQLVGEAGSYISTEDFMALIGDEETEDGGGGIQEEEIGVSERSLQGPKAKGMLVFFPGIPGCAKSALCQEILSIPNGLGGHQIKSLMGDMTKGRYWQIVKDERNKNPSFITLADKNAPNIEVWKQIEDICQSTSAIAVPIVTDSEGAVSNPYSLEELAIFISRVLKRERHPGKLDKHSPYPGYVLLMFYNLYNGKDRQDFVAELKSRFGHLVKMPLLKPNRPPMPAAIEDILNEGLNLYNLHSNKHGRAEPTKGSYRNEWAQWERKLKEVTTKHAVYFDAVQVPFADAVSAVKEQLNAIATGDFCMFIPGSDEERSFHSFTFAAVKLPAKEVIAMLNKIDNDQAKSYLIDKNVEGNLRDVHVTLAHKRSHGVAAVAAYGPVRGSEVPVVLTALVYSKSVCALEAQLSSVVSKNPWPHVTVWTAHGFKSREANRLPQLLSEGAAIRVAFPPVTVTGSVEFL